MASPTFSEVAGQGLRTAHPSEDEGWVPCMGLVSETNKTQIKVEQCMSGQHRSP